MSREKKTVDVYRLLINYGYGDGCEVEVEEYTPKEIRDRRREYEENCPQYPVKVKKGRERITTHYIYGIRSSTNAGQIKPTIGLLRQEADTNCESILLYYYGRKLYEYELEMSGLEYVRQDELERSE